MPAVPHPCMDSYVFELNTGDSLVYLKLKPGGGISRTPTGLEVVASFPMQHIVTQAEDLLVGGSLAVGIVSPGGAGPVSSVLIAEEVVSPFDAPADFHVMGSFNGILLPPVGAASACLMHLDVTVDDVTYKRLHTIGYSADGGGGSDRAGFFSRQQRAVFALDPEEHVIPKFIILYEVVGDGADLLQASSVQYDGTIHTR
jgi:hypothetical protein